MSSTRTSNDVEGEILSFQALFPDGHVQMEMETNPLLAYKAHADPDTMYLHEALREDDKEQFIQAMKKEVQDQIANKNFTIIHKDKVPKGEHILPMVWQMRRKRDIKSRQIKKHKARLNVDGSKMIKGLHYNESYSPVASWNSVRAMLTMVAVNNWHTKQIDFVQAFPQAPAGKTLYLSVPRGFHIEGDDRKDYVLKLERNLYGKCDAGKV